jgi:hypothetical protein
MIWQCDLPDDAIAFITKALLPMPGYRERREYTVTIRLRGEWDVPACRLTDDGNIIRWLSPWTANINGLKTALENNDLKAAIAADQIHAD